MISFISSWAEQLIVAVVIGTIIEMILPSGNNKKYIKAVIGVYILFTIISPILGKFTNLDFSNIDYEKYFNELDTKQAMSLSLANNNDQTVEEIYLNNLKLDMKAKLQKKGYVVEGINLNIELEESNYGKINNIWLTLYKKDDDEENESSNRISVNKVEEVKIGNNNKTSNTSNKKEISNSDKKEIKEYLSSVYEVNKKDIKINE